MTTQHIRVDRTDKIQKALSGYSGRVESLLSQKKVRTSADMIAALDDFLGALFALLFARQSSFQDRMKQPIEVDAVVRRSRQLSKGEIKSTGPWIAGFHFNSAIYRLAAAYHRVLKVVTGNPDTGERVDILRCVAERRFRSWTGAAWSHTDLDEVLGQVNKLKHSRGVFYRRTVKYDQAMNSANELLELTEAWSKRKKYDALTLAADSRRCNREPLRLKPAGV